MLIRCHGDSAIMDRDIGKLERAGSSVPVLSDGYNSTGLANEILMSGSHFCRIKMAFSAPLLDEGLGECLK